MKKIKPYILIIMLLVLASTLMGCKGGLLRVYLVREVEKIEEGDFIYNTVNYYDDGDVYRIIGFTEQGFCKEEIVFPTEIAGIKVCDIGNTSGEGLLGTSATSTNYFINEKSNVKKVFIPADINLMSTQKYSVFPCEKAVFLSVYPNLHRAYEVYENQTRELTRAKTGDYQNIKVCCQIIVASGYKETFDEYYVGNFIEANVQFELNYEVEDLDDLIANYAEEVAEYCRKHYTQASYEKNYNLKLNRYKHEVSNNEGIYWIDHLETGRKLKTIPQNPTREGYAFGGWYLDKECENPADLTAVTPNEDGSTLFLYAKWKPAEN